MAISVLSDINVPTPSTVNSALSLGYADENYADITSIVPAYDPTLKYRNGSFVSYGGKIYQCTTASQQMLAGLGEFDEDDWTEVGLASNSQTSSIVDATKLNANLIPTSLSTLSVTSSLTVPTPTADTNATTKKYVDDKAVCGGNKIRFLRRVFTTQNQTSSLVINYSTYGFASDAVFASEMEKYAGFCWIFLGRAATLTHPVRLPTIDSDTLGSLFETNGTGSSNGVTTALTFECMAMVKAPQSGSHKITFDFQDEYGHSIEWIGNKPEDLDRGKIYYFVLRNIIYDENRNRKWIGNRQGEVVYGNTPSS